MKAFCALGTAPRLERQEGPSAQDIKRGSWGPNNRFPGPAKPRECQAQIHSLHSFSTPAQTQKPFQSELPCPLLQPNPSHLLRSASIQHAGCRVPFFPQPLRASAGWFPRPGHSAFPRLPHALQPRATGTRRSAKGCPGLQSAPAPWGEPPPSATQHR